MTRVFADTSFYVALLNAHDQLHRDAVAWLDTFSGRITTSEFILLELANFMAESGARQRAFGFVRQLLKDPVVRVIPASSRLLHAGLLLYGTRGDKGWSLTDCTSFVLMRRLRLREALTADRHFKQAGFSPVSL